MQVADASDQRPSQPRPRLFGPATVPPPVRHVPPIVLVVVTLPDVHDVVEARCRRIAPIARCGHGRPTSLEGLYRRARCRRATVDGRGPWPTARSSSLGKSPVTPTSRRQPISRVVRGRSIVSRRRTAQGAWCSSSPPRLPAGRRAPGPARQGSHPHPERCHSPSACRRCAAAHNAAAVRMIAVVKGA